MPQSLDPLKINERLYRQVAALLDQLEQGEHVTLKERFQALMAIARIQFVFVNLRKEKLGDDSTSGSAVRKYAGAFASKAPHDAGRRKKGARPARVAAAAKPRPEPSPDWFEHANDGDGFGDDDDAA